MNRPSPSEAPDPWKSPASELRRVAARGSQRAGWLATIGVAWQGAIVVGFVNFAFEVAYVFQLIQQSGSNDPKLMAYGMQAALVPLWYWSQAGAPGLLLTALALLVSDYRPRWLFWWSAGFSLLYLLAVPLGPFGSILLLGTLIAKRHEFFPGKPERV
jgi:hypothetical protein